ncbi:DUF4148 domain-containing protein [Halomonas huangheensis]|uniref:Lipoprotein n=1 Tax=Halomonas huangheensis TaxID=1178482 RepID=W1N2N3_9GAMM|nr:DUF4148 domain-containing protein [Halomonas huangheensis]ALM51368.1 hypothetical protein AR456_02950 [Halomonas huangheensis]ERL49807.1 hypothetical protein BJB45_01420 [Halomonas huangheensis]
MKHPVLAILIFTTVLGLSACTTTQPIQNVEAQAITSPVSREQVRQAIVDAAENRGWVIIGDQQNEITAAIDVRTHQATVRIPYSSSDYSIIYKNSINLDHRGDRIHRNYNHWVDNLDQDIRRNLNVIRTNL